MHQLCPVLVVRHQTFADEGDPLAGILSTVTQYPIEGGADH